MPPRSRFGLVSYGAANGQLRWRYEGKAMRR